MNIEDAKKMTAEIAASRSESARCCKSTLRLLVKSTLLNGVACSIDVITKAVTIGSTKIEVDESVPLGKVEP